MACNHKYGAAYPDSSQSSGYARECGLCGDIIEAEAGDTCDHNWVATENVGFSSGYGYVCTICGELGDELDPQPPHSHTYHSDGTVSPTCTEQGYTKYVCNCGAEIKGDYTPALGHKWVAERNDGFSSGYGYVCSRCGELGEELTCNHSNRSEVDGSRIEPTCTEYGYVSYICEDCGHIWQETLPKTGHTWHSDGTVSPTCTESGYTNYVCDCGETRKDDYTPALGHNWVAERNDGFSSGYGYVCSRCGELGEELACTHSNHSEVDGSRADPTCTENGYVSYICEDCGHIWQETLPAHGHDWGEPFYSSVFSTGYGQECSVCGELQESTPPYEPDPDEPDEPDEPTPPTHTHTWQKGATVAPTCTAAGYTKYYCSCGATKTADTTAALGHSYGTPYYSSEFSSGYGKKCVRCGELVELDPPVTECQHTFVLNKVVAATCEVGGYSIYICSKCGMQEQRDATSALGHTEGAWVEDKAATCETDGAKHQVCAVCGKTIKTETVPALGHDWGAPYFSDEFSSGYGRKCSRCGEIEELTKPDGDEGEVLLIEKKTLTAIADAVREKTGGTEPMTAAEIPNNIRGMKESDPTVPAWAKQPNKPTYTAEDVGARPNTWTPTPEDIGLKTEEWTFTYEDGTTETKVVYVG